MITQDDIKRLFIYNGENLIWRVQPKYDVFIGDVAGSMKSSNYRQIGIKGKLYYAHILIFLYHYGRMPKEIDHIDGNKFNNKIKNLRECTRSQNCWNTGTPKTNTSGIKGVSWRSDRGKWRAYIKLHGKTIYLGCFKHIKDAGDAVSKKRVELHGEFANHG